MEGTQSIPDQQPPQQPYQQPYYQQPYQQVPVQPKEPPPIPSSFLWLAIIGIIILVVGLIMASASVLAEDAETSRNMEAFGTIIGEIGGLLLVLGLIVPAFSVKDIDGHVRAGLLISVALVIGLLVLSI